MFSNVLAIESSSERATVAVLRASSVGASQSHERFSMEANRHAENLLPLITEVLSASNLAQKDLDAISVGVGPGSFTGLRAGIALSVGLGLGLNVPVFGVSSLTALASALLWSRREAPGHDVGLELVGALLDARRGDYFFAAFDAALTPVVEPCVLSGKTLAADIARAVQQRPIWVAGQAAVQCLNAELLAPTSYYDNASVLFPSARAVAQLVGTTHATLEPLPQYLREPDVKVPQLHPNPLVSVD